MRDQNPLYAHGLQYTYVIQAHTRKALCAGDYITVLLALCDISEFSGVAIILQEVHVHFPQKSTTSSYQAF